MLRKGFSKLIRYMRMKRDPVSYARSLGVTLGHDVRIIGMDDRTFGSEPYLVTLGNHVTITGRVQFITHDGGVWVFRQQEPDIELIRPITVGSNVFIGLRTIILSGVTVGDNVVIGAGSVVVKDLPSDCVAAGVPAKVIRPLAEYRRKIDSVVMRRTWQNQSQQREVLERHFGRRRD